MTSPSKKKRSLTGNFSSYAVGNVINLLAGLVSFPLFARTLTVSEYGGMSLLNAALSLLTSLSKGGIQNTINRFWTPEGENGNLVASCYSGVIACFLAVTVVTAPGFHLGWFGNEYAKFSNAVLLCCYLTVLLEVVRSVSNNISVIQKKANQYSILNSLQKYSRILFPYLGVLIFADRMLGISLGFLCATLLTTSVLLWRQKFSLRISFEKTRLSPLFVFGFPLMLNELVDYFLTFCDRFFIAHYLGSGSVGMYSAAYNLSNNLQVVLITSIGMTTTPLLLERFRNGGFEEMKKLLRRCIMWYCLLAGVVIALAASVGPDLLVLLASSKYREATPVILPVVLGVFLYGLYGLSTSTLFFRNQTKMMLCFCLIATAINILGNWMLVPTYGIIGAAWATLVSYLFLGLVGVVLTFDNRVGELGWALARVLPALAAMFVVNRLSLPGSLAGMLVKTLAGVAVWSVLSLVMFRELRERFKTATGEARLWLARASR